MGLLDGGIASIFGAALGGLYLPATLHVPGTRTDDEEGNISYGPGTDVPCRAQMDAATYAMRQSEGYSEGDVRIIILTAGLGAEVTTDCQITVSGKRWMVGSADLDAASSHWVCRGRAAG
ncbi:hypothetical protein N6H05_14725 [Sphingobium sp. WTD-1]|uniref:hypothetical protein n=1 Tax=Sphingobium sp. WTD-1 TaxID=2979467 RepID=UPI0024DEBAD9|nr:hypothetical protein [Sphingobium sp. WTD-1]WIA54318.1 hypothetical protein N6H05_14725 [Sphingobium sp. WTD-1]